MVRRLGRAVALLVLGIGLPGCSHPGRGIAFDVAHWSRQLGARDRTLAVGFIGAFNRQSFAVATLDQTRTTQRVVLSSIGRTVDRSHLTLALPPDAAVISADLREAPGGLVLAVLLGERRHWEIGVWHTGTKALVLHALPRPRRGLVPTSIGVLASTGSNGRVLVNWNRPGSRLTHVGTCAYHSPRDPCATTTLVRPFSDVAIGLANLGSTNSSPTYVGATGSDLVVQRATSKGRQSQRRIDLHKYQLSFGSPYIHTIQDGSIASLDGDRYLAALDTVDSSGRSWIEVGELRLWHRLSWVPRVEYELPEDYGTNWLDLDVIPDSTDLRSLAVTLRVQPYGSSDPLFLDIPHAYLFEKGTLRPASAQLPAFKPLPLQGAPFCYGQGDQDALSYAEDLLLTIVRCGDQVQGWLPKKLAQADPKGTASITTALQDLRVKQAVPPPWSTSFSRSSITVDSEDAVGDRVPLTYQRGADEPIVGRSAVTESALGHVFYEGQSSTESYGRLSIATAGGRSYPVSIGRSESPSDIEWTDRDWVSRLPNRVRGGTGWIANVGSGPQQGALAVTLRGRPAAVCASKTAAFVVTSGLHRLDLTSAKLGAGSARESTVRLNGPPADAMMCRVRGEVVDLVTRSGLYESFSTETGRRLQAAHLDDRWGCLRDLAPLGSATEGFVVVERGCGATLRFAIARLRPDGRLATETPITLGYRPRWASTLYTSGCEVGIFDHNHVALVRLKEHPC